MSTDEANGHKWGGGSECNRAWDELKQGGKQTERPDYGGPGICRHHFVGVESRGTAEPEDH